MVDSTAISGQIFLILILDQFSQRRKIRLEQANLIKIIAKLNELVSRSYNSLKQDQLQILQTVHPKTVVTSKEKFGGLSSELHWMRLFKADLSTLRESSIKIKKI